MRRRGSAADEKVDQGVPVVMRATTWGLPDTRATLGFLKDRTAKFRIKEDDSGRDVLLGRGPDDVDSFSADIVANRAEKGWTTQFEEETGFPLVPLAHAELYFEVRIEEETCKSPIIRVPQREPRPTR